MRKVRIKIMPKKQRGGNIIAPVYNPNTMAAPSMQVRNTLGPVPEEDANLEAEQGETAYIPNVDGMAAHYKIGGSRHNQGGTPLNLPDDSFIFSDTRGMKIKDPNILKFFGKGGGKSKKGFTPAELAKKYDINKYRKILADPDSDKLMIETAERMIANYNLKLGKLALVQESQKGFPQGIPAIAIPYMMASGFAPDQILPLSTPGEEQQTEDVEGEDMTEQYAKYGAFLPKAQYGFGDPLTFDIKPLMDKDTEREKIKAAQKILREKQVAMQVIQNAKADFNNAYAEYSYKPSPQIRNKMEEKFVLPPGDTKENITALSDAQLKYKKLYNAYQAKYFPEEYQKKHFPKSITKKPITKPDPIVSPPVTESDTAGFAVAKALFAPKPKPQQRYGGIYQKGGKTGQPHPSGGMVYQWDDGAITWEKKDGTIAIVQTGDPTWKASTTTSKGPAPKTSTVKPYGERDIEYLTENLLPTGELREEDVETLQHSGDAGTYGKNVSAENFKKLNPEWSKQFKEKHKRDFDPAKDTEVFQKEFNEFNEDLAYKRAIEAGYPEDQSRKLAKTFVQEMGFTPYKKGDPRGIDKLFGEYTSSRFEPNFKPYKEPIGPTDDPSIDEVGTYAQDDLDTTRRSPDAPWWLQDVVKTAGAAGDFARIKKYLPWAPKVTPYIPEPTFYDPTRELAANAEQQAIMTQGLGAFAGPQRIPTSNIMGQGAKNAASVLSRYNNQNVSAANQFNLLKADVMNRSNMTNANVARQLYDQTTIANQQFDNAKNMARQELRSSYIDALTNRAQTQALNTLYPHYQVDPSTGGFTTFEKGSKMTPAELNKARLEKIRALAYETGDWLTAQKIVDKETDENSDELDPERQQYIQDYHKQFPKINPKQGGYE